MDLITKISTIGRFSVWDYGEGILVNEVHHLDKFRVLIVLSFFVGWAVLFFYYGDKGDLAINTPKDLIGALIVGLVLSLFIYALFSRPKRDHLIINRMQKLIIFNGMKMDISRINYVDVGKEYEMTGYRYFLIVYMKFGNVGLNQEMDDDMKELTGIKILPPTSYTKGLMFFLANEINRLTTRQRMIEKEWDYHEFLSVIYLLFVICLFSFIAYQLISHL